MTPFELLAGLASVLGFALAIYQHVIHKLAAEREKSNVRVITERLRNVATTVTAAGTTIQLLVRRADDADVHVAELQNLGRATRAGIIAAVHEADAICRSLGDWRFGHPLVTETPVVPAREPSSAQPAP